jgi:glucose dehydrogenase
MTPAANEGHRLARRARVIAQKGEDAMTRLIFSALLALNISVLSTGASATDSGEGKGGKIKNDWITINKDYSSQRYVDLDQITPANVSGLKEVCEIQLNEPFWFSSGILKVGRTLYVSTSRVTYAFDAATCDLRWRYVIDCKQVPANNNNRAIWMGRSSAAQGMAG